MINFFFLLIQKLSNEEEKREYDIGWGKNNFNQFISDRISLVSISSGVLWLLLFFSMSIFFFRFVHYCGIWKKYHQHRPIRDTRHELCRDRTYPVNELPDTTVVIPFHNEARTTLLRTVWSILDRSPPSLINEVYFLSYIHSFIHSLLFLLFSGG